MCQSMQQNCEYYYSFEDKFLSNAENSSLYVYQINSLYKFVRQAEWMLVTLAE